MAKKKDKDKRAGRADAVRTAVDQAFQATAGQGGKAAEQARDRAQELVEELAQTAGRVREALDDLRPPSGQDLRDLRDDVRKLERRVAKLEEAVAAKPRARRTSTKSSSGSRS